MDTIGIGLYGHNGHQIDNLLGELPRARLVATAAFDRKRLGDHHPSRALDSLDELLADDEVQLVSLCSPRRRDQAADAIACLEAGKHVYAEKPCAMTEAELDEIIATSRRTGRQFHEMAGSAFEQPYLAIREQVQAGAVGEVIQVFAQKSYPYFDARPQDEDVDGGLTLQVGVHALRFVEHLTDRRCTEVACFETRHGNPKDGELRMATALILRLDNGAVANVVSNYLNSPKFGSWGNEHVRIWGSEGFIEATDGGQHTRLCRHDGDRGALDTSTPAPNYLERFLNALLGGQPMPLDLETELHPTRMVIRARAAARI